MQGCRIALVSEVHFIRYTCMSYADSSQQSSNHKGIAAGIVQDIVSCMWMCSDQHLT